MLIRPSVGLLRRTLARCCLCALGLCISFLSEPSAGAGSPMSGRTFQASGSIRAQPGSLDLEQRRGPRITERLLYSFQGGGDGAFPSSGVISDSIGALFGTTSLGGSRQCADNEGCGSVYKLTPAQNVYRESLIYTFPADTNSPAYPFNVVLGAAGTIYGTTDYNPPIGGSCAGTLFKLVPGVKRYTFHVLYCFTAVDGVPNVGLIRDRTGAFYGTTYTTGSSSRGTVFRLERRGSTYAERILHSFQGGIDGAYPRAGVVADAGGSLYGTTELGGLSHTCGGVPPWGCGTVFKLTPSRVGYRESILHTFTSMSSDDGAEPRAGLTIDSKGNLYGTTYEGGGAPCSCGTVFKLTRSGTGYAERVIYNFPNGGSHGGSYPVAPVITDRTGSVYGTTGIGGLGNYGAVFKITHSQGGYSERERAFQGPPTDGWEPQFGLLAGNGGRLFGTTYMGGSGAPSGGCVFENSPCGTVYEVTF